MKPNTPTIAALSVLLAIVSACGSKSASVPAVPAPAPPTLSGTSWSVQEVVTVSSDHDLIQIGDESNYDLWLTTTGAHSLLVEGDMLDAMTGYHGLSGNDVSWSGAHRFDNGIRSITVEARLAGDVIAGTVQWWWRDQDEDVTGWSRIICRRGD